MTTTFYTFVGPTNEQMLNLQQGNPAMSQYQPGVIIIQITCANASLPMMHDTMRSLGWVVLP